MPLAAGDAPLFPTPLHLVRRIEDPIANRTSQFDEYCAGDRIVSVDGFKTVIVDYRRGELLQIDRAAATYSVSSFEEIAGANALTETKTAPSRRWTTTATGSGFEIATDTMRIRLAVDQRYSLSRKAFDALTGATYPSRPSEQHEAVAQAAARHATTVAATAIGESYAIPVEQAITFDAGRGDHVTIRNTVVSITSELPPPEVLAVPAGARLVSSRAARFRKSFEELKDLTPHP